MGAEPLVVILLPYVRWNALLDECVQGCLRLDYGNFRICLLPTRQEALPAALARDPRIQLVASGQDGISLKRNLGMRQNPDAEFYACIDSDAVPTPDWLRNAVAALRGDSGLWLVGGPDLSPRYADWRRQAVARALLSLLVSGPRAYTKRGDADRAVSDLKTCNLVMRASAARVVGGFDESLAVGEDSAFCQAVAARGGRLAFRADVIVYHHARRLFWPYAAQRIAGGYGVPQLLRLHGRSLGWWAMLFRLLPALALLWLAGGWLLAPLDSRLGGLWLATAAVYLAVVLLEAARYCGRPGLWPATCMAIVLGNLLPGLGLLARLAGWRMQSGRFYRNDA